MDFLEFVRNNEIEIRNNRIYKRYYLDNSYADPDCYTYGMRASYNVVGPQKFWIEENGRTTDYILVIDYNVVGDIFGYKVKKGFEEKEVGFLYRIYGSNGEYYKFQPSCEEKPSKQESSTSYSTSSSSSSSSSSSAWDGLSNKGKIITAIVLGVLFLPGIIYFLIYCLFFHY